MSQATDVEEALALVRAKLAKLHALASERDGHVRRRMRSASLVLELNTSIDEARGEYLAARLAAAVLLGQPAPDHPMET